MPVRALDPDAPRTVLGVTPSQRIVTARTVASAVGRPTRPIVATANKPPVLRHGFSARASAEAVLSVNGQTGEVVLGAADVGADPAGTAFAVGSAIQAELDAHVQDTDNPHQTTAAQVGAEPVGSSAAAIAAHVQEEDPHPQYTTAQEASAAAPVQSVNSKTGTVTLDAGNVGADVAGSAAAVQSNLTSHVNDTDNPHQVTAAQVGADPAGTAAAAVQAHVDQTDPHPQYTTTSEAAAAAPVQSVNGEVGEVVLTAGNVGADPEGTAAATMAAHTADADPHPQYLTKGEADALYDSLGAAANSLDVFVGTDAAILTFAPVSGYTDLYIETVTLR